MTIDEARAHIGDGVIWRPSGGGTDSTEEGAITSVSDRWVYVRFTAALTGVPIDPAYLTLLAHRPSGE
jgi:hypothetical protein